MKDVLAQTLWIYAVAIAVSMVVAVVIRTIVMVLGRLLRRVIWRAVMVLLQVARSSGGRRVRAALGRGQVLSRQIRSRSRPFQVGTHKNQYAR